MENNSTQSFSAGFSLGLLAGVVSYYLFGTKEGQSLRVKINTEWKKGRNHFIKNNILDSKIESLADFFNSLKDQVYQVLEIETELPITIDQKIFSRKRWNLNKKKKTPKKFIHAY